MNKRQVELKKKYVVEKAKMVEESSKYLLTGKYAFSFEKMFNDNTFALFPNLNRKYINEYKDLLDMYLLQQGGDKLTDAEKLVWSSEFLSAINQIHDQLFEKLENLTKV